MATTMEHALVILNSLADPGPSASIKDRDAEIRGYLNQITALPKPAREALSANPRRALEVIDPSRNSIGCLFLLDTILVSGMKHVERQVFLDKIVRFFTTFDPIQIRYAGAIFRNFLEFALSGGIFPAAVTVELLATVILRINPTASLLTSTHLLLAKIAVESNILEPALEVLDKEITCYPTTFSTRETRDWRRLCDASLPPILYISTATGLTDGLKSSSILEYNFLRSLVYSSRRDWSKAFVALEQVITHPTKDRGVSKVMTECHKRWLLVGLLSSGKIHPLPSYTSQQPVASYNSLSAEYKDLADLFVAPSAKDLRECAETNAEIWQEDGTTSLVAEVLSAYQKWEIINLRKVFAEVSVSQIRRLTSSALTGEPLKTDEDVIALIQDMLGSGMLKGTLESDGTAGTFLKFGDASSVLTEEDFARELATRHMNSMALVQQYKEVNERLSNKKEYVKYVALEQKRAEKEGHDPGVGFDNQIEDEDLMTGVVMANS